METIIVATDFSPAATNAIKYAGNLARYVNAKLVLIHAFSIPPGGDNSISPVQPMPHIREAAIAQLKEAKKNMPEQKGNRTEIECVVAAGSVAEVVNDAVNKFGGEIVIMGMEGSPGPIKRHLVGSSVFAVIKRVKVPVMIIPENVSYESLRKISLACDLERVGESTVIYNSRALSAALNAELEIVNVRKEESGEPLERLRGNALIEKALRQVVHHSVTLHGNDVSKELEDFFNSHPTGLVILEAVEHNFQKNIFAPGVTKKLVYDLKTPVLLIR
jgi:nucleotide-binding universal stress UspA family protein